MSDLSPHDLFEADADLGECADNPGDADLLGVAVLWTWQKAERQINATKDIHGHWSVSIMNGDVALLRTLVRKDLGQWFQATEFTLMLTPGAPR